MTTWASSPVIEGLMNGFGSINHLGFGNFMSRKRTTCRSPGPEQVEWIGMISLFWWERYVLPNLFWFMVNPLLQIKIPTDWYCNRHCALYTYIGIVLSSLHTINTLSHLVCFLYTWGVHLRSSSCSRSSKDVPVQWQHLIWSFLMLSAETISQAWVPDAVRDADPLFWHYLCCAA